MRTIASRTPSRVMASKLGVCRAASFDGSGGRYLADVRFRRCGWAFCTLVKIDYSSSLTQPTISINNEVVSLLADHIQANLMHYYPPSFLANSHTNEETQQNSEAPKEPVAPVNPDTPTTSTEEQLNVRS